MSSMPLCAAHHPMPDFNGDAIAQYMRTDFITLPDHLSVNGAREYFVSQLTTDDIPGQVFVVAGKALRGVLSIKRLLQEKDTSLSINHLTDSCLFHVKPDDERAQVVAELAERELDLVAVVEKGELVGCLMEKRLLIYRKMMLPKMFSFRGQRCRWKNPTWRLARGHCGKNVLSGSCYFLSQRPIPAAFFNILKRRWNLLLHWPFLFHY